MKSRIKYVTTLSLIFLLMYSCSKKEGPSTPQGMIQGRWKLTKMGTDDNKDGIVEGYEISPVKSTQQIVRVYKGDGTGAETNSNEPNLSYTWNIVNSDTLNMFYKANDTVQYVISAMTSSDLTLIQYNAQPAIVWLYFVKS